jgi:hypothetical protein
LSLIYYKMKEKLHSKFFVAYLLFIISFSLLSCRTIKPERPPESYLPADFHPLYSNINIPIQIDIKKLEHLVNKQLVGFLYADTSFENNNNDNLMIKVWKKNDISLVMDGNQLSYSVPLTVWIKKRFVLGSFGISVSDTKEVYAELFVKFKTRISLNRNWTISTLTNSDGYEWISTPILRLGTVTVPLPLISDILFSSNQQIINSTIDKAFSSAFDLKKVVQKTWINIQVPIKIGEAHPLWAKITPAEIRTVPLQSSAGIIRQSIGIKAVCELFYGDEPSHTIQENLPDLKITSRLDNDINVNIMLDIPFNHINEIARHELIGYQVTEGKYQETIKDVDIYGNAENLQVALTLTGSVNGTIYLSGKPVYDKETSSLSIRDLDFDIRTRNVLLRSAAWIFHHNLLQAIGPKLVYPVGDELKSARNQLQQYLESNNKLGYFRIDGKIDNIGVDDIRITQESIKALFSFTGSLNVSLEPD